MEPTEQAAFAEVDEATKAMVKKVVETEVLPQIRREVHEYLAPKSSPPWRLALQQPNSAAGTTRAKPIAIRRRRPSSPTPEK